MKRRPKYRPSPARQQAQAAPEGASSSLPPKPSAPPEVPATAQEKPEPPQDEIDEQIIQRLIADAKAGLPASDDVKLLAELYDDIPRMEELLKQQEPALEQREAEEATRAKTPLAVKLEVTGCEFATVAYPDDRTIPIFNFETHPCIRGKDQPDQDCRTCAHVRIFAYGNHLPAHHRRYHHHGMVIPVADEKQAEQVAKMFNALELKPLVHPALILHTLKKNLETARRRRYEARERELQRRQAERFAQFRQFPA